VATLQTTAQSKSIMYTVYPLSTASLHSTRHLLTGIAGTDRAQPRRTAGRAGTDTADRRIGRVLVDSFFFQNRTLPVPVSGTRVLSFFFVVSVFFVIFVLQIYFLFCNVIKSE
jgi:hypothetical protein